MAVSANRLELLQIADAVAREKVIDRQIVIAAMEDAIAKAARSRYGTETDVHARIDPRTGELNISRHLLIVDQIENPATEILVDDARRKNPAAQVGDTIADTLPPFDFGRIAAQSAKQVIVQKVRDAEREKIFEDYQHKVGTMVSGSVQQVDRDDAGFVLHTTLGSVACERLVIATGGLSIPKMGASGYGYQLARQFGHEVLILGFEVRLFVGIGSFITEP